jgi:hypothetical protein
LLNAGIPMEIGSDGPLNPDLWIMAAVLHPANPATRLALANAVHAHTTAVLPGRANRFRQKDSRGDQRIEALTSIHPVLPGAARAVDANPLLDIAGGIRASGAIEVRANKAFEDIPRGGSYRRKARGLAHERGISNTRPRKPRSKPTAISPLIAAVLDNICSKV